MNWIGKYTYGSTFFRGTRIGIRDSIGIVCGYAWERPLQLDVMKLKKDVMFWDDTIIIISSIDGFLDFCVRSNQASPEYNELYEMVDKKFIIDFIENGWDMYDHKDFYKIERWLLSEVNNEDESRVIKDCTESEMRIKNADALFFNKYEELYVIDDMNALIDELQEINIYAKMNNVDFT